MKLFFHLHLLLYLYISYDFYDSNLTKNFVSNFNSETIKGAWMVRRLFEWKNRTYTRKLCRVSPLMKPKQFNVRSKSSLFIQLQVFMWQQPGQRTVYTITIC